jgi:hypothetical protein
MHAMKAYEQVVVWLHSFLISALDEDDWLTSRPGRFISGGKVPALLCVGVLVGPRTGLGALGNKVASCL